MLRPFEEPFSIHVAHTQPLAMAAPERAEPPMWAAGVTLSLTGVPKAERAAIQQLLEGAGGRYGRRSTTRRRRRRCHRRRPTASCPH